MVEVVENGLVSWLFLVPEQSLVDLKLGYRGQHDGLQGLLSQYG